MVKFQIDRPKMKKVIRTPSFLLSHMPTVNRSDEAMDFFSTPVLKLNSGVESSDVSSLACGSTLTTIFCY